ncbi:MAG: pyrroline-5-carboxylate reductase [gamma proteobacterium symbiont of Bathyaustriella thionipta]|nr:pyrroline-5-carboxylate reductase [gamma proteobacterium symbiont of Bathyaustriella thionipta]
MNRHLAFIGGGNMARSLIGGLLKTGLKAEQILVSEPDTARRQRLQQDFAVQVTDNNLDTCASDCLIAAVKPQLLPTVARQLAGKLDKQPKLLISIAAGIRSRDLSRWLGGKCPLIRCMPNTPALVGQGACGLYASSLANDEHKQLAENIMQSVGLAVWTDDEAMMDSITALSGSGPAYFFLLMQSMQQAAVNMGMTEDNARKLTLQTALGAASMASNSPFGPAELRAQVTSPNGTTEAALNQFFADDFSGSVERAMQAAARRSAILSQELGES